MRALSVCIGLSPGLTAAVPTEGEPGGLRQLTFWLPSAVLGPRHLDSIGGAVIKWESFMANRIDLCSTGDVASGNALRVEAGDLALAVFNVDGEFYVTDDQCTHGPGLLSEGYIEDDVVECNFHNGQFNIKTGEVVAPPCMIPIKTYRTTVENGRVFIETD
jgi:nitrite reductase/ring-hydroxylating ferredoxin subunit